nr:MAG TPA: putative transcriptional regulator [Caudoviricetes sp.]
MNTLREIIKEKNLTNRIVADALNISETNIRRYDDLTKRNLDELGIISNALNISLSELIRLVYGENASILIDEPEAFLHPTDNKYPLADSANKKGQPILDIRVCAGHGIGLEGDENKVVEWVNIPKFDGCYGVTVYGDSMYDRFKSGDIIFVRPIQGRSDFDFGQCYVVITNEDRYIKNIYQSGRGDEYITMTSYNTEINPDGRRKFPDRDILIDDIKHLYKVAGKLRRDQL